MNIIRSIKESKLHCKKGICVFLLLSHVYFIFRFILAVRLGQTSDFLADWLPVLILFINNSIFFVYFVFVFGNRRMKTVCFIIDLLILTIESVIMQIICVTYLLIAIASRKEGVAVSVNSVTSAYLIISQIIDTISYIALAVLAGKGLRNKTLTLIFSVLSCVFAFSFLNIAITIFCFNNYLPIINHNANYSFENKSCEEKLAILKDQFDDGVITEDEYKERKKNIIDDI